MLDRRWRKVLRDAWLHKARTLMVILALTIGLAGAGTLLDAWALIQRVTEQTYLASQPVSATLRLDRVDAEVLAAVRALPQIADVRARRVVSASLQAGGRSRPALLFALDDYTRTTIGKLQGEVGPWPPRDGEVTIERSALEFATASVGESVTITVGAAPPRTLPLTGVARDVALAPGWMDNVVYAFVTAATLRQLGAPADFNELQFRVRDARIDRGGVRRIAQAVKALVEQRGGRVQDIDVPVPGEHMHAAQMDSLMFTQGAFGLLTLVVCALLVINLVAAMLASQVREIGILKTLGARNGQIGAMYLASALLIGVAASALAVPMACAIGYRYAGLKAEMLNFPLADFSIPVWIVVAQFAAGCLLPVAAAAFPVSRGCRLPVAVALRDIGITDSTRARRPFAFDGIGRPLLLSLNNAFRKRARLLLTVLALAAGGAVYLGAANLRASVIASVDHLFASQRFDFSLRLADGAEPGVPEKIAAATPGVERAEAWTLARAIPVFADTTQGGSIGLIGVPAQSPLFAAQMERGRWLTADDGKALVVSLRLLREDPAFTPGAQLTLQIADVPSVWTIVGVVDAGPERFAFVPQAALADANRATLLVVASTSRATAPQLDLIQRLRTQLAQAGIAVASSQRMAETKRVTADHLLMVVEFLGAMGWVMILVGGFGLAATLSLAVLERQREIGVLRAIGARHRDIVLLIAIESLVIALIAWLVAIPLSLPMSLALADAFGRIMFPVPAAFVPDLAGVAGWLLLVIVASLLASLWPALRATRVATAATLSYE